MSSLRNFSYIEDSSQFKIDYTFVENWAREGDPRYFQIFIYLYSFYRKTGMVPDVNEVATKIRKPINVVKAAFYYWEINGVLLSEGLGYRFRTENKKNSQIRPTVSQKKRAAKPKYDPLEIEYIIKNSPEVKYLINAANAILKRNLNIVDYSSLYSFHDYFGMSIEVIVMMLEFAAKSGKTARRNLESIAKAWSDDGILTYDEAEIYVKKLESAANEETKIKAVIGVSGRNLSEYEKKYIKMWAKNYTFSQEMYELAYSKTIARLGKISMSYMSRILENWAKFSVKTVADAKKSDENYKHVRPVKQTKFSNFSETRTIDYKKIEDIAVSKMMKLKDTGT